MTSCHIGSRLSSLLSFFRFCFPAVTASCYRAPFTGDSLSGSASLHHAHTLTFVLFSPLPLLCFLLHISERALSLLCMAEHSPSPVSLPSPLNPSPSIPLILTLFPQGVIAGSQASIFMTIIEARMLMPLDFSLPVSQRQLWEGKADKTLRSGENHSSIVIRVLILSMKVAQRLSPEDRILSLCCDYSTKMHNGRNTALKVNHDY